MEKKRVIFVTNMAQYGGIETYVMNLLRYLDTTNYQIDFIRTNDIEGPFDNELKAIGCNFFCVPNPSLHVMGSIKRHRKAFKKAIDSGSVPVAFHFHACTTYACFDAWLAKHYVHNIIIHSHSSSVDGLRRKVLHYLARRPLCKVATHRLACSRKAGIWMFGDDNYELCPNGIDIERFQFNQVVRERIRKSLGIADKTYLIGTVGRLTEVKNQTFLLDVIERMRNEPIDYKLLIIGDGPLKKKLIDKCKYLGLEDRVLFIGSTHEVDKYYNAMDLFVMPSLYEGLPFVCVEAQVNNLPCVFSSGIDSAAVLTDSTVQIPIDKTDMWVASLVCMSKQKHDRAKQISQNIIEEWSIKRIATRISKLYER